MCVQLGRVYWLAFDPELALPVVPALSIYSNQEILEVCVILVFLKLGPPTGLPNLMDRSELRTALGIVCRCVMPMCSVRDCRSHTFPFSNSHTSKK